MEFFSPPRLALALFTFAYVVAGAIYLLREGNHEFVTYLIVLVPLIAVAFYAQVRYDLPLWMLWLLSVLGALHLAGGAIRVHGDVLYALVLVPVHTWTGLTMWKFDQLVHPYGAAAIALIAYRLLARTRVRSYLWLALAAFMIANGAGALNEVIEFATKLTSPDNGVGGYYNTALDLTFNMVGAALGTMLALLLFRNLDRQGVSG